MKKNHKSIIVRCTTCGKQIRKYISQLRPHQKRFFCSSECVSKCFQTELCGENNPNFNNKWNDDQRKHQSDIMKKRFENPDARYRAGNSNRGKKLPGTSIKLKEYYKTHPTVMQGKHHTPESRLKMSKIQKQLAEDTSIRNRIRETNEKNGVWVDRSKKSDFEIYYSLANWKERMFNLVTDQIQLERLKTYGVYSARTNKNGVARDHMYSIHSGFENGVFPEILHHPCNCELILFIDNCKKRKTRNIDGDSQTLEQLFNKIKEYKGSWKEQELVCSLIDRYNNGERWANPFKK